MTLVPSCRLLYQHTNAVFRNKRTCHSSPHSFRITWKNDRFINITGMPSSWSFQSCITLSARVGTLSWAIPVQAVAKVHLFDKQRNTGSTSSTYSWTSAHSLSGTPRQSRSTEISHLETPTCAWLVLFFSCSLRIWSRSWLVFNADKEFEPKDAGSLPN